MSNQGTESQFEATTIERLEALGYRYEYGCGIEREVRVKEAEKLVGAKG